MYFEADTSLLDAAQALCVALPAAGLPVLLRRFGGGWSLVAPLSVVATVVAITVAARAPALTWIALLLVPPGCALALGYGPWRATVAGGPGSPDAVRGHGRPTIRPAVSPGSP